MPAPSRRSASNIIWLSPSGETCSLVPMSGGRGLLEVEIHGDLVCVHSRNCMLKEGDEYTELSEYEFALSLQRCQLNWSCLEHVPEAAVERSAYFSQ